MERDGERNPFQIFGAQVDCKSIFQKGFGAGAQIQIKRIFPLTAGASQRTAEGRLLASTIKAGIFYNTESAINCRKRV